jgi:hypothetical protein
VAMDQRYGGEYRGAMRKRKTEGVVLRRIELPLSTPEKEKLFKLEALRSFWNQVVNDRYLLISALKEIEAKASNAAIKAIAKSALRKAGLYSSKRVRI